MKKKLKLVICIGSACFARGNARNVEVTEKFLKEHQLADEVELEISGGLCAGNCADGPNVIINDQLHSHVTPEEMLTLLNHLFPARR